MRNQYQLPHLTWGINEPYSAPFGWVAADGEIVHHIADVFEIYMVFGFVRYMKDVCKLPQEFSWAEYRKHRATVQDACIQALLASYLNKKSSLFRNKHGQKISIWIGGCSVEKKMHNGECQTCSMHLPAREAEYHESRNTGIGQQSEADFGYMSLHTGGVA
jgi:hypothetical protein